MTGPSLLAVFAALQHGRRRPATPILVLLAVVIWALVHAAGVHATIAGAALGLLMRTRERPGATVSPSHHAEHLLRPWTAALVLPVFALTSAGVAFTDPAGLATSPAAVAVFLGLVLGKVAGITGGVWLTTRLTRAELHPDLRRLDILGIAQLAGIGFTVSLLIAELSYPGRPGLLADAKGAVLIASATAAALATVTLTLSARHRRKSRAATSIGDE